MKLVHQMATFAGKFTKAIAAIKSLKIGGGSGLAKGRQIHSAVSFGMNISRKISC